VAPNVDRRLKEALAAQARAEAADKAAQERANAAEARLKDALASARAAREQQADDELDTALGMPSGAELVALVEAASIDRSLPPTVPPPPTRRVASSLNTSCPPTRPSVFLGAIDHPEGSAGAFVRTTRRDWAQKIKRFGEPAAEQLARALTRFIAELRSIVVWHKVDVLVHSQIERFGARLRWNVEANAPVRRPLSAAEVLTFFLQTFCNKFTSNTFTQFFDPEEK
jgi:hypothetical protein